MDERSVKRLLITLVAAIAIIMLAKFMLTNTVTRLNQAAANKKLIAARPQTSLATVAAPAVILPESAPAIAIIDAAHAASAVQSAAQ
jgi:hypothetical protein